MRMTNSGDYDSATVLITPQDIAIIFHELDIGIRRQAEILSQIWEQDRWILPKNYSSESDKKRFLKDVYYQIDYLYNKDEIDNSLHVIRKNAQELGYNINKDSLTEDERGISEFFKTMWIKLNYINESGLTKAKIRTILKKYHYKRRSQRFCEYFERCMGFYHIEPTVKGETCDIRTVELDVIVTFRIKQ